MILMHQPGRGGQGTVPGGGGNGTKGTSMGGATAGIGGGFGGCVDFFVFDGFAGGAGGRADGTCACGTLGGGGYGSGGGNGTGTAILHRRAHSIRELTNLRWPHHLSVKVSLEMGSSK